MEPVYVQGEQCDANRAKLRTASLWIVEECKAKQLAKKPDLFQLQISEPKNNC